jgi:uncharacterized membrane protein
VTLAADRSLARRPRLAPAWAPVAAVVAVEIPYPLLHGSARDAFTVLAVATAAVAVGWHAVTVHARRGAALVASAAVLGLGAEVVGVHTGVPFGDYRYLGGIGPSLLGVPVVVALAWATMAYPAWLVAGRVAGGVGARIVVGAVALAAWDVFLDPQMVWAGHWRWADPSPHLPGVTDVPLTNFAGWLAVSLALMAVAAGLLGRRRTTASDDPMLALWLWAWVGSTLANLAFLDRPAVALWGALAMATVGVALLLRLRPRTS